MRNHPSASREDGPQQGPVCRAGPAPLLSWSVVFMLVRAGARKQGLTYTGTFEQVPRGLKTACRMESPKPLLNCVKQVCRFGFSPATNRKRPFESFLPSFIQQLLRQELSKRGLLWRLKGWVGQPWLNLGKEGASKGGRETGYIKSLNFILKH